MTAGRPADWALKLSDEEFLDVLDSGTASSRYGAESLNGNGSPAKPRFRVLKVSELAALPAPEYLVEGVLPAAGNSVLYGTSGTGKSFVALDWALSIATGQVTWQGRTLAAGPVVYVAAEGQAGLTQRIEAWMHANGVEEEPDLYIIPDAVQLLDRMDGKALVEAVRARLGEDPVLIVLDTLAKCMPGGDENSTQDMGLAMAGQDYLRTETGACVLLVHHPAKNSEVERGNSSLRASQDAMLLLKAEDGYLTLQSTKMRDGPALQPMRLRLQPALESAVPVGVDQDEAATARLTKLQKQALQVLEDIATSEGCSTAVWAKATELKERTFYSVRKTLISRGYVVPVGKGRNAVSPVGRDLLQLQSNCKRPAFAVTATTAFTGPTLVEGGSDAVQHAVGDAWEPEGEAA